MKKLIAVILIVLSILAIPFTATAQELEIGSSRPRMAFHGGVEIGEDLTLITHFLPTPDLKMGLSPLAYLELKWSPTEFISVSPTVGYDFGFDEPIASLRLAPRYGVFWGWFDFEWTFPSHFGYTFGQTEVKVLPWLSTGLEYEFWGSLQDLDSWSFGGGPSSVFHLGSVDLELALHFRGVEDKTALEFVTRAHLFLF